MANNGFNNNWLKISVSNVNVLNIDKISNEVPETDVVVVGIAELAATLESLGLDLKMIFLKTL